MVNDGVPMCAYAVITRFTGESIFTSNLFFQSNYTSKGLHALEALRMVSKSRSKLRISNRIFSYFGGKIYRDRQLGATIANTAHLDSVMENCCRWWQGKIPERLYLRRGKRPSCSVFLAAHHCSCRFLSLILILGVL